MTPRFAVSLLGPQGRADPWVSCGRLSCVDVCLAGALFLSLWFCSLLLCSLTYFSLLSRSLPFSPSASPPAISHSYTPSPFFLSFPLPLLLFSPLSFPFLLPFSFSFHFSSPHSPSLPSFITFSLSRFFFPSLSFAFSLPLSTFFLSPIPSTKGARVREIVGEERRGEGSSLKNSARNYNYEPVMVMRWIARSWA